VREVCVCGKKRGKIITFPSSIFTTLSGKGRWKRSSFQKEEKDIKMKKKIKPRPTTKEMDKPAIHG